MAIPKIIHQTYKSTELPTQIEQIVTKLKDLNPDWEYRFYTDDDILAYITKHFDERTLKAYMSINPVYGAAKADLFRYLVLYREGGVYLDIKSTCIYPLDDVIKPDDTFIVTQWQNEVGQKDEGAGMFSYLTKELGIQHGEYQQWFIICEKNSPIIKYVIDCIVDNIINYRAWQYGLYCYGKRGVLFVTGPVAYTKAIYDIQDKYPIRFLRYDKEMGFVYNALNKSHIKVLANHYEHYKGYIINQGLYLNILSTLYIGMARITKSTLKLIGKFKE